MSFTEMSTLIDFLVPAFVAVVLLTAGVLVLRSNKKNRAVWKFPVGWFALVIGAVFAVGSIPFFVDFVDADQSDRSAATAVTTTMPASTASPPQTVDVSWCDTAEGMAATFLAADSLGYLSVHLTSDEVRDLGAVDGDLPPQTARGKSLFAVGRETLLDDYEWDSACRTGIASTGLVALGTPVTRIQSSSSKYTVPAGAAAVGWAWNAIAYVESLGREWSDRREAAVLFYANYALRQCSLLSGLGYAEVEELPSNRLPFLIGRELEPSPPTTLFVPSSTAQIEANMRQEMGIEAWESFGEAWYDSLVNGLCIRR